MGWASPSDNLLKSETMMKLQRSSGLSKKIYQNMKLKETDELLEIWFENDRTEWSEDAFEAIHSILFERLGDVPPQEVLRSSRKPDKNPAGEKVKLPWPITLTISALLLIVVLLSPLIEPKPEDQWFTILMFLLFEICFFAPGLYFGWLSWIKSAETKQRISNMLRKNKEARGILFRHQTLFLPDRYLPTFFLWQIRIYAILLIYAGVKMISFFANVSWQ